MRVKRRMGAAFFLDALPFGGGLGARLRALRCAERWPLAAQLALVAAFGVAAVLAGASRRPAHDASTRVRIDLETDSPSDLEATLASLGALADIRAPGVRVSCHLPELPADLALRRLASETGLHVVEDGTRLLALDDAALQARTRGD